MKIFDGWIEELVGGVGVANFEGIEGFGVENADNVATAVDDWEMREA